MKRREAIRSLGVIGVMSAFPNQLFSNPRPKKPHHIIGLGGAGCNILEYVHANGVEAKYTCISRPARPNLPSDIEFIEYHPPIIATHFTNKEICIPTDMSGKLIIPDQVWRIFEADEKFVLYAGLGGFTGTFFMEQLVPWLQANKKDFQAICSIPFSFERQSSKPYVNRVMKAIKPYPNFSYFELDDFIVKKGGATLTKFFELVSEECLRRIG
ncbi:MAG: hypothetical protein SGJ00_10880 [bacterium]|nr:hypothetical protein [bacterium]